jgi:uncharacterized protein YndB with AHSA1/START domain
MSDAIQPPVATARMMIRRPVAEVFEAMVDPAVTMRFWFSRGSGRMAPGARVRWEWEMYGAGTDVDVKEMEEGRRVAFEWNGPDNPSQVEWRFEPMGADRTMVSIRNWGFGGDADAQVRAAVDSAGGYAFVLAGLKAYLEHGVELNLVPDHAPDALVEGWVPRG